MNKYLSAILLACISIAASAQSGQAGPKKAVIKPAYLRPPTGTNKIAEEKKFTKYYLNVGTHTEFYNNVQVDDSGAMRKLDFAPTIGLGITMPFNETFVFLPELNWVLPRSSGKVIKNLLMFRGDLGYSPVDWFRVRFGSSIMWLNQHGQGGKENINNGSGQSTFYYPDENRSSLNNTLDIGGEFLFDEWALRLQTYTYSIFREERRQISYTIFATYYWDR